jgi:voltage-gated potassium channel
MSAGVAVEPSTKAVEPSTKDVDEPRLAAWTKRTEWPLTGLAVVFLATYAWQVLDVTATPELLSFLDLVMWGIWTVFAVDYLTRLVLATHKGRFVWRHLVDLLAVALPMFRQLRVLRVLVVLNVVNRRVAMSMRGRVGVYLGGLVVLIGLCASLAVLDAERDSPDANITEFTDALWWALATITTVGYGDRYPTTAEGRLVAATLMIGGIALLGAITGMVASWFVERIRGAELSIEEANRRELAAVRAELAALRDQLAGQSAGHGRGQPMTK